MTDDLDYIHFDIISSAIFLEDHPGLEVHPDIYIGRIVLPGDPGWEWRVAVIPENDAPATKIAEMERIAGTWREYLNVQNPGFFSKIRAVYYDSMRAMREVGYSYQQIADQINEKTDATSHLQAVAFYSENPTKENEPSLEDVFMENILRALGIRPRKIKAICDGNALPFTKGSVRLFMKRYEDDNF